MKRPDIQSLERAFTEALSLTQEDQRQAYLSQLAEQNPELAADVRKLLEVEPRSNEFFEAPRHQRMRLLMTTLGGDFSLSENELVDFLELSQAPQSADEIARLGDQFALNELIACGATGFIFRGWDCHLDRKVAIKVLAPSICKELRHRSAFIDEARFTSQINHPNVVTIYHVASGHGQDHNVFFVMEWIEGFSLQSHLDRNPQHIRDNTPSILRQLSDGITAIHKRGIVHRDIKPGNILIETATGRAVIIDFGLAFESSVVDAHLLPAGTPLFMSPEQIMGQKPTDRSDQFSFAVVAFQLLTGQHPFLGNSIDELLENIRKAKHRIETLHSTLPEAAKAVFCKAFSTSTKDRFESVKQFFEQLCITCPELTSSDHKRSSPAHSPTQRSERDKDRFWSRQKVTLLAGTTIAATTLGYLGLVDRPERTQQDPTNTTQSTTPETSKSNVKPEPDSPAITSKTRERQWIDETTMINFAGIEFAKVSAPSESVKATSFPPFPSHPEYTDGFDWRYYTRPFLISKSPITYQQYYDVMGKFPALCYRFGFPTDMNEPVTNIFLREAQQFCQEMSRLEGTSTGYTVPELPNLTFAAYGKEMLADPESVEQVEARILSGPKNQEESPVNSLRKNPYGDLWEFTVSNKSTYQATEGLVSLSDWGRRRNADEFLLVGGGAEDLFVHWFDLNNGCNDNFVSVENLTPYTETDGMTSYLRPTELGKRGNVVYRYQANAPITSARIQPSMFLHSNRSECGIQIRARRTDSGASLSELPWSDVIRVRGKYINAPPIDITPFVSGMDEFEIQYWILTEEEPLHYSQIFRGVLFSRDIRSANCFVRWTTQRSRPSVRPTGPAPEHYADPKVTFRVQTLLEYE